LDAYEVEEQMKGLQRHTLSPIMEVEISDIRILFEGPVFCLAVHEIVLDHVKAFDGTASSLWHFCHGIFPRLTVST